VSRATRPDGPLDEALHRLRAHGLPYRWAEHDIKVWQAVCPGCLSGGWEVRIRESRRGGPITLICANGCTDPEIRAALDREPVEPRAQEALALAERASDIAAQALALRIEGNSPVRLAVAA